MSKRNNGNDVNRDMCKICYVTFVKGIRHYGVNVLEGQRLFLIREPDNPHDQNAVAVKLNHTIVGYIDRQFALALAPVMDYASYNIQAFAVDVNDKYRISVRIYVMGFSHDQSAIISMFKRHGIDAHSIGSSSLSSSSSIVQPSSDVVTGSSSSESSEETDEYDSSVKTTIRKKDLQTSESMSESSEVPDISSSLSSTTTESSQSSQSESLLVSLKPFRTSTSSVSADNTLPQFSGIFSSFITTLVSWFTWPVYPSNDNNNDDMDNDILSSPIIEKYTARGTEFDMLKFVKEVFNDQQSAYSLPQLYKRCDIIGRVFIKNELATGFHCVDRDGKLYLVLWTTINEKTFAEVSNFLATKGVVVDIGEMLFEAQSSASSHCFSRVAFTNSVEAYEGYGGVRGICVRDTHGKLFACSVKHMFFHGSLESPFVLLREKNQPCIGYLYGSHKIYDYAIYEMKQHKLMLFERPKFVNGSYGGVIDLNNVPIDFNYDKVSAFFFSSECCTWIRGHWLRTYSVDMSEKRWSCALVMEISVTDNMTKKGDCNGAWFVYDENFYYLLGIHCAGSKVISRRNALCMPICTILRSFDINPANVVDPLEWKYNCTSM